MILSIDTTEFGKVVFTINENASSKIILRKSFFAKPQESDKLLENLDKFFLKNKLKINSIKSIKVYKGSGTFTGLRIAAAIGQALSLAWQVPFKIVNKK